jgi:hypothetical protein
MRFKRKKLEVHRSKMDVPLIDIKVNLRWQQGHIIFLKYKSDLFLILERIDFCHQDL